MLTPSEVESLRRDLNEKGAYLLGRFQEIEAGKAAPARPGKAA